MSEPLRKKITYKVDVRALRQDQDRESALSEARAAYVATGNPDSVPGVHVVQWWANVRTGEWVWRSSDDDGQSPQEAWRTITHRTRTCPRRPAGGLGAVVPAGDARKQTASERMTAYHAAVRALRAKRPRWSYQRARQEYAKQAAPSVRSLRMREYHAELRRIRAEHPRFSSERARREYARRG